MGQKFWKMASAVINLGDSSKRYYHEKIRSSPYKVIVSRKKKNNQSSSWHSITVSVPYGRKRSRDDW